MKGKETHPGPPTENYGKDHHFTCLANGYIPHETSVVLDLGHHTPSLLSPASGHGQYFHQNSAARETYDELSVEEIPGIQLQYQRMKINHKINPLTEVIENGFPRF